VLDIKQRPHRWDLPRLLSSLFNADNRSPVRIFYPTPRTLDVAGVFIDEVTDATSAPTKVLAGARDYINFVASAERICSPSIGIKDSVGDIEARIALALQAGVALGDKRATDQELHRAVGAGGSFRPGLEKNFGSDLPKRPNTFSTNRGPHTTAV
jgi:hypothetical protein